MVHSVPEALLPALRADGQASVLQYVLRRCLTIPAILFPVPCVLQFIKSKEGHTGEENILSLKSAELWLPFQSFVLQN